MLTVVTETPSPPAPMEPRRKKWTRTECAALDVLLKPSQEYRKGNPQPADIRLLVEISDSSLAFDLKVRARLYARAGIVEYWVFDVPARRLVVHRNPLNGSY